MKPLGTITRCGRCGADIVWARTVAGPNGPGGKAMPLDPYATPLGNVAVRRQHSNAPTRHTLLARVLGKDDGLDVTGELRAMPHFATCHPQLPLEPAPSNVTSLAVYREKAKRQ